jgi:hypothetical protein
MVSFLLFLLISIPLFLVLFSGLIGLYQVICSLLVRIVASAVWICFFFLFIVVIVEQGTRYAGQTPRGWNVFGTSASGVYNFLCLISMSTACLCSLFAGTPFMPVTSYRLRISLQCMNLLATALIFQFSISNSGSGGASQPDWVGWLG